MFLRTVLALITLLLAATTPYDALKTQAEKFFGEKSFSRAHELYEQASGLQLPAAERRWVEFRLADTSWRAAPDDRDVRQKAQLALEEILRKSPEPRDRVWAEANESLGELTRNTSYSLAALDWWAGSADLPLARRRYLAIVWRLMDEGMEYQIPREVFVNAAAIAESPKDRARARFLVATHLLRDGRPDSAERALEHFEAIIKEGKTNDWYDEALFFAASAYESGRNVVTENGEIERKPDYTRALELYRRLVNEFAKGESQFRDNAQNAIDLIVTPSVGASVAGTFLPDSEQEVLLTWRNVKRIDLSLIAVDLTDFQQRRDGNWIEGLRTEGRTAVRKWTHDTNDAGAHVPGWERIRLTPRLERGAYVLLAQAEGKSAKQLVLVTDAHILLHASARQLQIHVSDVLTGEPIAGARVRVTQQHGNNEFHTDNAQTDANGIAVVAKVTDYAQVVITAVSGKRQAWHSTYAYSWGGGSGDSWRIYAFTDRPAYRPGETVQWKIIARTRGREQWMTPAGARVEYEITSPRGEKVASGEAKLNAFGSFWAELPLTETMPLGQYVVTFKTVEKNQQHIGSAQLFRLEEYKLPEYQVSVTTAEENGKRKLYRLGDTIEATIEASYYFGGPVANATVEAVVYQQPFYRIWFPWREYDWYYDRPFQQRGGDMVLKRETLRTDANGRAVVRIDTSPDGNEMLYRIEARVVDASRREVRGEGTVRVTKQRYSVVAHPEHYLHRPGDRVEIELKATDANDQPVQTSGKVKVVRREWRDKQRAYRDEDVLETDVTTDANGEATFTFTPKAAGYYTVRWSSVDAAPGKPARVRDVVTSETSVWVADHTTRDLGYYATGGIEIIIDRDTVRAGQTAAIMIASPMSGRWVVFNATGDDILDTQVFRLDGTVKLIQLPIDSRHVPNFFVTASSLFDRALSTDTERVVVPPVEHFLNVEVKPDREQYQPREEGTVTITTRDVDGKPVSAEVALAVSDEAVTAIQQDPAGDPRQFFFGETRQQNLQVSAGVQSQQYIRLIAGEDKVLIDDRYKEGDARRKRDGFGDAVVGGVVGGRMAMDAMSEAAPAPVPPPPPGAPVSQAVTVTATAPLMRAESSMAKEQANAAEPIDVQVRSDFRSTAFWKPDVVTDASGTAVVRFKYPEALTTWRATARAASAGAQFGIGTSTAKTNMPLIVRLQSPRFFVQGDRSVVSAVINNNTDEPMRVTPGIEVEGLTLSGGQAILPVQVPAHGESRADWTVVAEKPGAAKLRVTGRGEKFGDAMEKSFVVWEHGIDKLIARSGKLRGTEALIRLELPRERRATDLTVQIAPSLAVTMLDALPYLIDYPYGCTEQTMSRFLPAAIVAQTLQKMGLDARKRIPRLDDVTKASIARLYDFQHGDGGWGWWKEGTSDAFMTAYVVWGFSIARDAGMNVDSARIDRAYAWLNEHLVEQTNDWNEQAWMLHAMSAWNARMSKSGQSAFDDVWEHRERLTSYSRALLALTAHRWNAADRAAVLVRNLENGVKVDKTPDQSVLIRGGSSTAETMATAHWGSDDRYWWRWHDGPVETTAFVLQALVTIDPKHALVEPAMNWLVKNRRGAQWSNTRDTAIAVLSLNDYLRASGETVRDVTYELSVNGRAIATKTVTAKELLAAPSRFSIDPSILKDTTQEISIKANAPVYFSAEARFVSLEEPVKAAGNELFVRREYFRLAPHPTLLKGVIYERVPLGDNDSIHSGERVEVVVTVETKNDYEYLLFEDLKPAGFEAVELQSGASLYATGKDGRMQWIYQELRDRKVAMFADRLPQGTWEIRYTLRAETPGSFHALPLMGHAMYVPDIRANGDEVRVRVVEP